MFKRFVLFLALTFGGASVATAQDFQDFTEDSFNAALDSGQPIVVNFYETWCSRCATQRRNLSLLLEQEAYEDVIVLEAIFSENRDFASNLGINARTSLALIVDRELAAIDVGGTSVARVQNLLDAAG